MRILLTGATGYIAKRLLPILIENNHHVICCVRDSNSFALEERFAEKTTVITIDFLKEIHLDRIPKNIDAAYYLMHSMSNGSQDFSVLEKTVAHNFIKAVSHTTIKHVIYLSGIVNDTTLSKHLQSRKQVETILHHAFFATTTLRAGIIVGSGSASFEIIRDLVEKLPVMVAPKWLNTKSQPIAIRDVLAFLQKSLLQEKLYHKSFDIGGPNVLSYKQMLLQYAQVRGLKRSIYTLPVMTPKLSSYWLYFVTATSYALASALVSSMKIEVIAKPNTLAKTLGIQPISYKKAIEKAFLVIKKQAIPSSWKDARVNGLFQAKIADYIEIPQYGCFIDHQKITVHNTQKATENLWNIGGDKGWYYANFLWRIRGYIDKLFGGIGLRRGRTNPNKLQAGDALDFWRVLHADKQKTELMLFAEMKVPGEAWLHFYLDKNHVLHQRATFRPKGLAGRIYWYVCMPFHFFIFKGMLKNIATK